MIINCISDLHGNYPELDGGDLLIVAGDLTAHGSENQHALFDYWINDQRYKKKVVIGGNHDNFLKDHHKYFQFCDYLCDSGTEFDGLKIWGSPWTQWFEGVDPDCKAFMLSSDKKLAKKWALIPDDTDILVTHCPPWGFGDKVQKVQNNGLTIGEKMGSHSLSLWIAKHANTVKLHVFGHVHEGYGRHDGIWTFFDEIDSAPIMINASIVDELYRPVNKPIKIEL